MESNAPKEFNNWAIVEMFGHTKEVGYVTTQYFGPACLFQIDVPGLAEREVILESSRYLNGITWAPAGTKVRISASPKRSRLIGPGSIYSITPCSEATAMAAIESLAQSHRDMVLLELPKITDQLRLTPPDEDGREPMNDV